MKDPIQLDFFDREKDHIGTWSAREIWLRLDQTNVASFSEDSRFERKSAPKATKERELAEYYSMWSNTVDGGIVVVGIADKGEIEGVAKTLSQKELNRLESFHSEHCPDAKPEFRRIPVKVNGENDFIVSIFLPYRGFLVETSKGEAFIRRGSSKHKMSSEERDDFRSTRHERSWELRESAANYPQDFDEEIIKQLADNFRSLEDKPDWTDTEVLVDRNLLVEENGKFSPTNSLVLLASKNPRRLVPGARVRIQRFAASEEGAGESFQPIKDLYAEGPIPILLQRASQIIESLNYDVTWLSKDGKFQTTTEYPRWAWFEALVNALVHRSYSYSGSEITIKFFSDRLEIESPGGFVPPVNASNVYSQRASRNPHLCEALRHIGYTRMTREGTRRMKESMEAWHLPAPDFSQETIHGVSVRVTLRNDQQLRKRATDRDVAAYCGVEKWQNLKEHEVKLIGYAFNNGKIHVAEAERLTGRRWNTSKKDLERLVSAGLLEFVQGQYSRDPKAHYAIIKR